MGDKVIKCRAQPTSIPPFLARTPLSDPRAPAWTPGHSCTRYQLVLSWENQNDPVCFGGNQLLRPWRTDVGSSPTPGPNGWWLLGCKVAGPPIRPSLSGSPLHTGSAPVARHTCSRPWGRRLLVIQWEERPDFSPSSPGPPHPVPSIIQVELTGRKRTHAPAPRSSYRTSLHPGRAWATTSRRATWALMPTDGHVPGFTQRALQDVPAHHGACGPP